MRHQQNIGAVTEEEMDDSLPVSHSDQDNEQVGQYALPNTPYDIPISQGNGTSTPHPNEAGPDERNERSLTPISQTERRFKEKAGSIYDEAKSVHGLMKGLSEMQFRMVNTMFDIIRAKQIRELEQTLKSKYEMKLSRLKAEKDELEEKLRAEQGSKHDAVAMASECQMQINKLKEQAVRNTDGLSERIAAARQGARLLLERRQSRT